MGGRRVLLERHRTGPDGTVWPCGDSMAARTRVQSRVCPIRRRLTRGRSALWNAGGSAGRAAAAAAGELGRHVAAHVDDWSTGAGRRGGGGEEAGQQSAVKAVRPGQTGVEG